MKKVGDTVGCWVLKELLYTKQKKNRHYWRVECSNCSSSRQIEESNMKPPAGGRCQACWGQPQGWSGRQDLIDSYRRNSKKLSEIS